MFSLIDTVVLFIILIICSISDIKIRKVKDRFILIGILVRVFLIIVFKESFKEYLYNIITAVVISALLIFVLLISEKIFNKQVMGGADIKLIFMCGIYLGFAKLITVLFSSFLLTLIMGIVWKIKKRNIIIPYVPFLTISAFLVLLPGTIEGNYLTGQIIGGL